MGIIKDLIKKILGPVEYPKRKKAPTHTRSRPPVEQGNSTGRKIYAGLKKEMEGPTGQRVDQILRESCARSPLIRSLSASVTKYIHSESLKGRRSAGISKELKSILPEIAVEELESIARAVSSKASTALTQARAEEMGLAWYVWKTSKDIRVRPSHCLMDDVLVTWKDPPSPELLNGEKSMGACHAGEEEGCRCYPQSLIRIDDVKFPHKVYRRGKIENLSRTSFAKISRGGLAYDPFKKSK